MQSLKNTAKRKETDKKCKNRIYSQTVIKALWHPKLRARLKNGGLVVGHFWHPQHSALNLRWIWVGRGPTMTLWAPYTPVFFPVWHQNWLSAMGNQSLSLWCDDQFLDSKNQLKKNLDKRTFSLKLYLKRYSMSLQIKIMFYSVTPIDKSYNAGKAIFWNKIIETGKFQNNCKILLKFYCKSILTKKN